MHVFKLVLLVVSSLPGLIKAVQEAYTALRKPKCSKTKENPEKLNS